MIRRRRPIGSRARLFGSAVAAASAVVAGGAGLAAAAGPAAATSASHPSGVDLARPAAIANVQRVAGASRIDTAIATSQDEFPSPGSARAVVLARSDTFPDALAGGPLAAAKGGPLLLTTPAGLDASVLAEIQRVLPPGGTVYVLGGSTAISSTVDSALTAAGYSPTRLAGADRTATAVQIADAMGDPSTVFEATGWNFPDALAGVPAAITGGGVILLTNGTAQAPATAAYLAAHPGGSHYALGGPAKSADPGATPLAGADRYATAGLVADQFFLTPTAVGVATGTNFPDALAAGPDLAAKHAPLLLVPPTGSLPESTVTELLADTATTTNALVFGGVDSVSDAVASQVGQLAGAASAASVAGASSGWLGRYGVVSEKVIEPSTSFLQTDVVDNTTGDQTFYVQGSGSTTAPASLPTSGDLAGFPLDAASLETAVNNAFGGTYESDGYSFSDPDAEFVVTAESVLLDPNVSPTLRLATYRALAIDPKTTVTAGVKDAEGRVGIDISAAIEGNAALSGTTVHYVFDPATSSPLQDQVTDGSGANLVITLVTSMTTTDSAPSDPYTS